MKAIATQKLEFEFFLILYVFLTLVLNSIWI